VRWPTKQPQWYLFRASTSSRFFSGNCARREFHLLLVPSMGLAPTGFHERLLPAISCSPNKRDAKRCSLASCNRSIWPSMANRPLQSQLTAARVKGIWPLGSLGYAQLARCRRSRRAVSVPLRPARASQARSDQARRGRPWKACVGRANGRVGQPPVGPRSAGISGMSGRHFFVPFCCCRQKGTRPPWEGGETRRTPAMPGNPAERKKEATTSPPSFRAK